MVGVEGIFAALSAAVALGALGHWLYDVLAHRRYDNDEGYDT
ncbi:hypothetical protein SEA_BOOSTSEASON_28 [Mycobacterium phage BoostSeason]|uniref:Uncharacterized protein n=1 Tax=Mycobacterium phage Mufasa TaxID=1718600 RepID=A0A0M4RA16_9CAUD|nr:hypothetical protein SEA_MUFASA_28 [Mycobacterium phage Mufasa]ALF00462.1 hypothetical protein SEA_MUFASA_28 [Mycobacterium phage Mufasa]AYN57201.1 hypothetical protein SEA_BOOSTSEASON_28 [Mycobacterium phage BoostSeason]